MRLFFMAVSCFSLFQIVCSAFSLRGGKVHQLIDAGTHETKVYRVDFCSYLKNDRRFLPNFHPFLVNIKQTFGDCLRISPDGAGH